jgi:two-component system sensor histidine kinase HydH
LSMDKASNHLQISWKATLIVLLVSGITALHFLTSTEHINLHQIYQRSYYIPIVLASFWFEVWGGLATAVGLSSIYIVHIIRDWGHYPAYSFQQYAEIAMYMAVAVLAGSLSRAQRKSRQKLEASSAELSAAYQKLNETFDQLRHSDRLASLGQLAAVISHEIRNPLGSIQGAVDILGQGLADTDPKAEFAQIARKEIAALERLTSEILQFSRPSPPKQMPINPREIIEGARRLCADQARRQGIEIDSDQVSGACILVDPEQIRQVLLNILINAIQVQPSGGKIEIRVSRASEEVVISIRDSGPGIARENLNRIFEPFFTTRREGTGLGLAISYQLVTNNGGRIRVESPPGEGACFRISFPADIPESAEANRP